MKDRDKTKEELINELTESRQRIDQLEKLESERKRAEETLRESEDRYRDLVEHSKALICTHDLEGRILSVNEWAARVLGYEQPILLKMNLRDILAPEVKDQFDSFLATIRGKGSAKGLMLIRTTTGENRIWAYNNTLRTEGVKESIVRGLAYDVTEFKQTERTLRETQQSLEAVMETVPSLIVLTDPDGRMVMFNRACEELTGYKKEEVFGKTISELFLPPEWVPIVQKRFADPFAPGVRDPYENPWLTKSGEERLIEWRCTVLSSPKDNRPYILGTGIDITKRKKAEEALRESEDRYRDLVENSQDFICTHDLDGHILSMNPAAVKLLGYDRNTILSMNVRDILAPNVRDQFSSFLEKIRRDGVAKGLMLVQTATGEERILEYNNTLRTEGVGSPIVRSITRDATERTRAEQALRVSEERYRQLFDEAPVGYHEYDTEGRITQVNRTELLNRD